MSLKSAFREGDRPIDRAFAQWVRRRSGSDLLARAALAASRAEGQGHACAALIEADFAAADVAALRAHDWVGDGSAPTPFVLDEIARLYTLRNWQHETLLAARLLESVRERGAAPARSALSADLDELFGAEDADATRWQRAAVAAAPGARLFVLTGGPGTGKTATALRLLLVLLRHAAACGLPETPSVALAAPTGKAKQRLAQAIAQSKQQLRARLAAASAFHALLDRVPHAAASTLHRLLGYRPADNTFARNPGDPLAADIVLVDEASMIDLALMRTLVTALRPGAVLILLGDPGQLAAVEAGSVLSDIVASVPENALPANLRAQLAGIVDAPRVAQLSPLAGHVITLTHVWRAGGGLQQGLQALRAGDERWLESFAKLGRDGALQLYTSADAGALRVRVAAWMDAQADFYGALTTPGVTPALALSCLRKAQVLCALREGSFGAGGLNALIEHELAARGGFDPAQRWYHGRPVLIVRNDYARELYNGDIGIALEEEGILRVWFEVSRRDGSVALRSFSPRALPEHETAWAITIHRSQGSEYDAVAVVLPPDPDHRILSRELLYTAVSRATQRAEIWATPASVRAAVARPIRRIGGLRERLS